MEAQVYRKEDMIRVSKLAKRWGRSRQHVYNMIDRGELTAFRFGGSRGMWVPLPMVEQHERTSKINPDQ